MTFKRMFSFITFAILPFILGHCGGREKTVRIEYTQDQIPPLGYCLVDKSGTPSPALVELLNATTSLKITECDSINLQTIVDATQTAWLRKAGSERWHIKDTANYDRDCIIGLFDQLCLLKEMNPHKNHYNYAFIFGSTARNVRIRLAYLLKLWKSGVRFDNLVFLGGARPLDPTQESAPILLDRSQSILPIRCDWVQTTPLPTTETDMMKFILNQVELPLGLTQINVQFIDAQMQKKEDGSMRRPNTGDTIAEWLATDPALGSCLFISHQPFVGYQDAVVRTYMPASFDIDTVGACASVDEQQIGIVLDNLARWLYQENIRRRSK